MYHDSPSGRTEFLDTLSELGARQARKLCSDLSRTLRQIWAEADDPSAMLDLLDAFRGPAYARNLRWYMWAAVEHARSYELPAEHALTFTPALDEAMALVLRRGRGEIAFSALPSVKRVRTTALAERDGNDVERAVQLVCYALAQDVAYGARYVTALVSDLGFQAAYPAARDAAQAEEGDAFRYGSPGAQAAVATGEEGRKQSQRELARLLRAYFPNPFRY